MPEVKENTVKLGRPVTYTKAFIDELADKLIAFYQDKTHIWLVQFAVEQGIPREQLSQLAKKNKRLFNALKLAKEIQELRLCDGALGAKNNQVFSIFALKNVAGWRDKTDVTSNGKSFEDMIAELRK